MAKDYARAFYDSPAWRRTREAYLQSKHYICEDCGGAASVVHHITYIKPWNVNNPEITLNWDNLKAVCENVNIPVYAIGGINIDGSRRQEVQECGAKGSCIMSGMMKA